MVTLKSEERMVDTPFGQLVQIDTKNNMLEAYELLGVAPTKSWKKAQLAEGLEFLLKNSTALFVETLPKEEHHIVTKLVCMEQGEYVAVPKRDDGLLVCQKLYMVVTYETADAWHLYMTDSVRKILDEYSKKDIEQNPDLKKFNDTMENLTACHDWLFELTQNVTVKPAHVLTSEAESIKADFRKYLDELKEQEAFTKSMNVDTAMLYSRTEEQIKLCDLIIGTAQKMGGMPSMNKQDKMLFEYSLMDTARKEQEIEESGKNIDKPVTFAAALTITPAEHIMPSVHYKLKLIRPKIMELTVEMSEATYMVCYIILQPEYAHVTCRWGNILDFVWNGVESESSRNPYVGVKKHFAKKYPRISAMIGQKEDRKGNPIPKPYITTIGMDGQPKEWWLSIKVPGVSVDDFMRWFEKDIVGADDIFEVIEDMRDACADIYSEIARSDAKAPKEFLFSTFGKFELNRDNLIDILE